jgi:UDP-2-acetamido-3-amino-2,3-dideoxy-glucuronate N-acetyltransferase
MIHSTSEVSPQAKVGPGTKVWARTHIRERAVLGADCIVGEGVYIDADVCIGNNVKIENGALLYRRLSLADGVFVGPQACFTNDLRPRAVTPEGRLKLDGDWRPGETQVDRGASIGAAAVVLPGVRIGAWAMIGAGALVTRDVPAHALAVGSPARRVGWVCACGARLLDAGVTGTRRAWRCPADGWEHLEDL